MWACWDLMRFDQTNVMPMSLFQLGNFKLHSGGKSRWKIECDALTDSDLEALALMIKELVPPFRRVEGVPRGGIRIADALHPHRRKKGGWLIVDDVLTTGASMKAMRSLYSGNDVIGAVIFARGFCPRWITPLFQMAYHR